MVAEALIKALVYLAAFTLALAVSASGLVWAGHWFAYGVPLAGGFNE